MAKAICLGELNPISRELYRQIELMPDKSKKEVKVFEAPKQKKVDAQKLSGK